MGKIEGKSKLRKIYFFALGLIFLIIIFLAFFKEYPEACINQKCFTLEIADSSSEREKGLMFRESLEENRGMVFVFENSGNYSFWMKNTLISLDIIWIYENKTIAFVKNNALPCNEKNICEPLSPGKEAKYVLEVNSGLSERYGFKEGDKVLMHLV